MFPVVMRPRAPVLLGALVLCVVFLVYQTNYFQNKVTEVKFDGTCNRDVINNVLLEQKHPCILEVIRNRFLVPPSEESLNLEHPDIENPSMGQAQSVLKILNNKVGGFFIECGALDGETRSNTLFLEQNMGWQGVLIEGDPSNFEKVVKKHRKAWSVPACLSTSPRPQVVSFQQLFNQGKISKNQADRRNRVGFVQVQCFPIYSILAALNQTTVDYFSLDIEGDELAVLKTIPWDSVDIQTLSVEFIHGKEGKEEIRHYMQRQGYEVVEEITHPMWLANDFIFKKVNL